MASTGHPMPLEKEALPPTGDARSPPHRDYFSVADVVLRLLLSAAAVVAVVVMVTSKETKQVAVVPVVFKTARFKDSPAFIYFVAALSTAGWYGLISAKIAFLKPRLLYRLLKFDALMLGIVASATGTAGGVAYIGMKGNSHAGWTKICNVFGKFCAHVEASVAVSIFASILLALLIILSGHSLSSKIPK